MTPPLTHNRVVTACPECGGSGKRMGCTREIECFDCSGEGTWTEEVAAPRPKYVPSPEYLAWLAEVDGGPDPLIHLEPKRAA